LTALAACGIVVKGFRDEQNPFDRCLHYRHMRLKAPEFRKLFSADALFSRPVLILAAIFFSITLVFGLHRYFTYFASYDQGIFNQVYWNSLHGRFFQSSLSSVLSSAVVHDNQVPAVFYHRLGQHFTPALLLWLPIYALFPSPATLVVLQVSLVTLGGLLLYALARLYLSPALSLMVTAGYYSSNAVIGPVFSNFHDLCQIPVFVFSLLLAMEKRIWWLVWLMAFLLLMVREDTGVVLFGVGVYMLVSRRFPRVGLILCAAGFGYALLVTNVFMPAFSDDISRRFAIERFGQYASGNQATTVQLLWAIASHPQRVLATIFREPEVKVFYLLIQTLTLVLIPLRAPYAWAIAGFPLLQLCLQKGDSPLGIHIRYAITLVPGLFYGAVLWWSTHANQFKPRFRQLWAGCIALSLLIGLAYNPNEAFYFIVPTSFKPWIYVSLPRQWEHASHINHLLQEIPPDASVSATTYIVPHVSTRREVLRVPFMQVRNDQNDVVDVDYLIADLWQLERYQVAFKLERGHLRDLVPLIDTLTSQNRYGVVGLEDKVILLKKGVPSQPELLKTWKGLAQEYRSRLIKETAK